MKEQYIIKILICTTFVSYVYACTSDETKEAKPSREFLSVEKEVSIASKETNKTVKIAADCHWEISVIDNQNWDDLTVSPRTGEGDGTLVFSSGENRSSVSRMAAVTIATKGGLKQIVTIQQAKSDADLSISQAEYHFSEAGGLQNLVISSNTNWVIQGNTDVNWLELSQLSGSSGTSEISIKVPEATDDADRSVTLTIATGNLDGNKIDFRITQSGKSSISLSVNNSDLPSFASTGDTQTVSITCNAGWRVLIPETVQSWLHVEPSIGSGNAEIRISCDPYLETMNDRMSVVTIIAGAKNPHQCDIYIQQSAATGPNDEDNLTPQFTR